MNDMERIRAIEEQVAFTLEREGNESFGKAMNDIDSNAGCFNVNEKDNVTALTLKFCTSLGGGKSVDLSLLNGLKGLTSLSLSGDQLTDVSFLKGLKGLTTLVLHGSKVTDVSPVGELRGLTALVLDCGKLTNISFLGDLEGLTSLLLGHIQLTDGSTLRGLKGLAVLFLDEVELIDASFLEELHGLNRLSLTSSKLTEISFLKGQRDLTSLNLNDNKLTDVTVLKQLKRLTELSLSSNQLTDVSFLKELRELTSLDLSENQLRDLSFLEDLKLLTFTNLSSNRLTEIPEWLAQKGMEVSFERYPYEGISFFENPIENPPLEIARQGTQAVLNYYRQIKMQGMDSLYEAKLLIVGEGGAGKTTLARKIPDPDAPLPYIDDRTKGITITPHHFNTRSKDGGGDRQFRLNIWDFGGQEIYHATHRFFLSRRSLYVLVADNPKDDTDFNYWLNSIALFAGDCSILIVLNEKDDVQPLVNMAELRSRYPWSIKEVVSVNFKTYEEGDSEKRNARLKTIRNLKANIEHFAANLPQIGDPLPARWIEIRKKIETDSRRMIYREQFDDLCRENNLSDTRDVNILLGYLHDLGIVLHFSDSALLRHQVFLKPSWATGAVYRIFDSDVMKAKQGRFSRIDCAEIWKEEQYSNHCDILIELMKNFRLVYEIGSSGNLIAPQLLPKDTPIYEWECAGNCLMEFRYDYFMPKGILWQFIVTMYRYIDDHRLVWRNGVVLRRLGARADVIENIQDRRIYIRLTGLGFIELRGIIFDVLNTINETYRNLKCEALIPCNCSECNGKNDPTLFEYSDLVRRREKRKPSIECRKSFIDVAVLPLLEGFGSPHLREELRQESSPAGRSRTIRIFLASSSELKEDREQFEIFINRENKKLNEKGIFLRLEVWEDFIDAMSQTVLQDEYNKAIGGCDLFVMLYFTKVGKYTKQEFQTAFGSFKEKNKPRIYTYFKNAPITTGQLNREDSDSLFSFQELLTKLGHFQTIYSNIYDLNLQFSDQLEKIIPTITSSPSLAG